jgi:hypothetical protein
MEVRFFEEGTVPVHTTPDWYSTIERAPHLEQEGHVGRLRLAADFVNKAVFDYGVKSISDLGAGDGGLLSILASNLGVGKWGYDLQPTNVIAARGARGQNVTICDVVGDREAVSFGDLSICTEFLEHLVDPHAFLRELPSRVVVASSPDGETLERRYEFHTWGWDKAGYHDLFVQAGYQVVRHESIGFQVLLGVR